MNISNLLTAVFSVDVLSFLRKMSAEAEGRGYRLYLVGGAVRDILLRRKGFDLDLSVEGDAIELAGAIAGNGCEITLHHRFNTARIHWKHYIIDLARSREESYPRPGALPTVRPGSIEDDLARRDFSINAMAVSLNQDDWGRLIDPLFGRKDLERRLIRVLHPGSFKDDASRLWRAVRYQGRLGFDLEPETFRLIRRDRQMLRTITPDRQRYELECILKEAEPEKILQLASDAGLLEAWHPAVKSDAWLAAVCVRLRSQRKDPDPESYLALLTWRLAPDQKDEMIAALRMTKKQSRAIKDGTAIVNAVPVLAASNAFPSQVFNMLESLSEDALFAGMAAAESENVRCNIGCFLNEWRYVRPELTGEDLKKMGVPQGPKIKSFLEKLRAHRLDDLKITRDHERELVLQWINRGGPDNLPDSRLTSLL